MRRIVVDPGVLVSAAITPAGTPAQVVRAVRAGRLELVLCPRLLAELAGVLAREKFRSYLTVEEADEYVTSLALLGETVEDPKAIEPMARDPGDDYLVALARSARATALVSGDGDLLALDETALSVLTPATLLQVLEESD